jgi:hypothetical protein
MVSFSPFSFSRSPALYSSLLYLSTSLLLLLSRLLVVLLTFAFPFLRNPVATREPHRQRIYKTKATPVTGLEMSRIPHLLHNRLTDAG